METAIVSDKNPTHAVKVKVLLVSRGIYMPDM
jgi:hypothetical protein